MRIWIRVGTLVVAAGVVGTLVGLGVSGGGTHRDTFVPGPGPAPSSAIKLVGYPSCADMLAGLRSHAARNVGPWGFGQYMVPLALPGAGVSSRVEGDARAAPAAPAHSTTNVHEAGVDEPDLVKTDGRRVVTVSHGALRVIDTATRRVTVSVRLGSAEQMSTSANLLLDGNRALVILPDVVVDDYARGPIPYPAQPRTRLVLVDLSGAPTVVGSLRVTGAYVDARMVGSTVRLVARSQPRIAFPPVPGDQSQQRQLVKRNRAIVAKAPLSAWLPSYQITDGNGTTSTRTVGCGQVSHPRDYTGMSMLTIYSVDLTGGLDGIAPISLAADGDIVYGTRSSLYVASNPDWWHKMLLRVEPQAGTVLPSPKPRPQRTEIHRFDIAGSGAPRYVASGSVPGRLLNQYSLSDYDGYLRVATTTGEAVESGRSTSSSAVYELNADTMARVGAVGGLGKGQRIYSVRFIGPVGYVVTFRQMDPLYTLDLRDPSAPRIAGELELTGYSAYLSPAGDGTLLGVGQEADTHGRPVGLQVSLFDVRDPAHPRRLARQVLPETGSTAEYDPHAFLYWPATGTAVLPVRSSNGGTYTASALVLKIAASGITTTGRITPPVNGDGYQQGVSRAMVIGDNLWTLSDTGIEVNDATTLARQAWIPLA